jgi:DNA repair ATPase RecN
MAEQLLGDTETQEEKKVGLAALDPNEQRRRQEMQRLEATVQRLNSVKEDEARVAHLEQEVANLQYAEKLLEQELLVVLQQRERGNISGTTSAQDKIVLDASISTIEGILDRLRNRLTHEWDELQSAKKNMT